MAWKVIPLDFAPELGVFDLVACDEAHCQLKEVLVEDRGMRVHNVAEVHHRETLSEAVARLTNFTLSVLGVSRPFAVTRI